MLWGSRETASASSCELATGPTQRVPETSRRKPRFIGDGVQHQFGQKPADLPRHVTGIDPVPTRGRLVALEVILGRANELIERLVQNPHN
jgi:hypothetical protein